MGRLVSIRHRVKKTAAGEAHPTMVAIEEDGAIRTLTLETDDDEKDFLLGHFPVSHRVVKPEESLEGILSHHITFKKGDDGKKKTPWKIPSDFEGFRAGDTVVMAIGGSGDRLAAALSRRGEEIGARVMRVKPFDLKDRRGETPKEEDHLTLLRLFRDAPELFFKMLPRDRDLVRVREQLDARQEAQRNRIACEQRIRRSLVDKILLNEDGHFPEGAIETEFEVIKASDRILAALREIEALEERELRKLIRALPVWQIFEGVEGCGEVLAAKIIAYVEDIRRFKSKAGFKKYCGVHCTAEGAFPRKRKGKASDWQDDVRQSFWLLADQWNKRPDSEWGVKLREWKTKLRARHPEVVLNDNDKKRYTDAHIHKMGQWRTRTKFAEWLFREWWRLEREAAAREAA